MYPEDPRSPFYSTSSNEMLPLAKLFIHREKLIPKKCSDLTDMEIIEQATLTENTEEEFRSNIIYKTVFDVFQQFTMLSRQNHKILTVNL